MTGANHPRVVVVDDDPEVLDVIAEYLTQQGFSVLTAANGLEALLQVKRNRPAAATLDLGMPRLGGLDALRRIAAFDPGIRVVVVTGELDAETHRKALVLGAAAVLVKPVMLPDLLAALRERVPAATPASTVPLVTAAPTAERTGRPTVLVVDDDPDIRDVLEDFLGSRGYAVRSAEGAASALREILHAGPDVVLLDIDLPGLTGAEALPAIRALVPDTAVIMVSGTADVEVARRTLVLGAFDYVTKPIDLEHLAETLEAAVAMRRLEL